MTPDILTPSATNPPWLKIARLTAGTLSNDYQGWLLCDRDDIFSICLTQAWLHRDEPESHQLIEMRQAVSKEVRRLYHLQSKHAWSAKFVYWSDVDLSRVCDLPVDFRDPWATPVIEKPEPVRKPRPKKTNKKYLPGHCTVCGRPNDREGFKSCSVCKERKAKWRKEKL